MILETIVGFGVIGAACWIVVALLRRFAGFDTASAILLSVVAVPAVLSLAFYFWVCLFARYCG
jgi:hypothetical protein